MVVLNHEMILETNSGRKDLFSPYLLGTSKLSHRIVLAPMTRCRAIDGMPNETLEKYYTQRSTPGGLLITEGTLLAPLATRYTKKIDVKDQGFLFPFKSFVPAHCPGIYTEQQVEAWKKVVDSVHANGAIIFCQLWHVNQLSDLEYQNKGCAPQISDVVKHYRQAALNDIRAGFDGVEIHSAHGYHIEQFLKLATNEQKQLCNESLEGITDFLMQVFQAVVETIGAEKVGVRISPPIDHFEETALNPRDLGLSIVNGLNKLQSIIGSKLAYLHVTRPRFAEQEVVKQLRHTYEGTFMSSGGYNKDQGMKAVMEGDVDLVAYGRDYISNPDLVQRFKANAPINKYLRETFYTHDPILGYIDYPYMEHEMIKSH